MKFYLATCLIALFVALVMAAEPQKPIIVSYPDGTPPSEMTELKEAIEKVGGVITHEYNLFMGLAAKVPVSFVDTIKTMGMDHDVTVEDDQVVSINDHDS